MRHIVKSSPNSFIEHRHERPPQCSEEAQSAWNRYDHKKVTLDRCLQEQFFLCGYSEIEIGDSSSINYRNDTQDENWHSHLEHIEPKSRYWLRTFDHHNLIASALSSQDLQYLEQSDYFGGHFKADNYDPEFFVSPCHENCRDYFHYESTGKVVPNKKLSDAEQVKAEYTINVLNLNAQVLVVWRKNWLQQLDKLLMANIEESEIIGNMAQIELLPNNNKLRPFHSAQRQFFGRLAEQVIQRSGEAL